MKHVNVDIFFIKEKLDGKILELPKLRSEDQLIDILTKVVSIACSQIFWTSWACVVFNLRRSAGIFLIDLIVILSHYRLLIDCKS